MADNEEGKENTSRGNEWEVVSLTASTYAAAPGPREAELKNDDKGDTQREAGAEISRALFMSSHFVFPPSEHENLPIELDSSEIQKEHLGKDLISDLYKKEGARSSGKDKEDWTLKDLHEPYVFPGIQLFDEKGNRVSISGTTFEEERNLQGLVSDKEQSIYNAAAFSSFHSETALGESTTFGEKAATAEVTEPCEQSLDYAVDTSESSESAEECKYDEADLPCGAWWKRSAASLYTHAKEANSFWSIFIAAAVMGLVILGQRWQQERWQALQLKWQLTINNEKMGRMLGPLSRLKDVIVGGHGHRPGSYIKYSSASES